MSHRLLPVAAEDSSSSDAYTHYTGGAIALADALKPALHSCIGSLWTHGDSQWRVASTATAPAPVPPRVLPLPADHFVGFPPVLRVTVGSGNIQKVTAAKDAIQVLLPDGVACEVVARGMSVASDVPGQPVGAETFAGARNRLAHMVAREGEHDDATHLFVAMENGLVETQGNEWCDVAAVVVRAANGNVSSARSVGVPVNYTGDMEECVPRGRVVWLCHGAVSRLHHGPGASNRFQRAYWAQTTRDTYAFYTSGAVTRITVLQHAVSCAVAALWHAASGRDA